MWTVHIAAHMIYGYCSVWYERLPTLLYHRATLRRRYAGTHTQGSTDTRVRAHHWQGLGNKHLMQWREHSLSFERMMLTDTELSVLGTTELKRNLAGWCLEGIIDLASGLCQKVERGAAAK